MATRVIMPALGMAQETGKILRWLKREGEPVNQGEPLAEIETDKATVELEAPASGLLSAITAREGEDIPVGQQIALILAPGEQPVAGPAPAAAAAAPRQPAEHEQQPREERGAGEADRPAAASSSTSTSSLTVEPPSPALMDEHTRGLGRLVSPLAARIAAEHQVDLRQLQPQGRRIQKADVLAYLASRRMQEPGQSERLAVSAGQKPMVHGSVARSSGQRRLLAASPKARRLAAELGQNLAALARTGLGSGPEGAILAADVLAAASVQAERRATSAGWGAAEASGERAEAPTLSQVWRLMAERTAQSWQQVPHFSLLREVQAERLLAWHQAMQRRCSPEITYTDLLVRVVAAALRVHPQINASWQDGRLVRHGEINIGLAVATDEGLVVPVIHEADRLSLSALVEVRKDLVERARSRRLRPQDLQGGTFTISNLGMYGVDAFNAIINAPQAAILAVGRISERVIAVAGQPVVAPTMLLSLSCDHRVIDGARGAQFLATLAELLEEPLGLLA
ncbi:MAG: 2-oxo acid dehydrogenase subunit E2 [Thermogemmatispora sp.]|uniref:dihydrolipoamide acetyltransferase family protein n=1 Tax=Thermogemmatispora sp. TaxID=1968838 RepID=UPI001DC79CDA|nr:dihydrolipoamide acetyltransferase family protein [Thermogemmatispora sp.]MBX5452251.1 2-oxo acid dehydrogenase subunit E2 [Thermogemmatispora sp.]